MPARRVGALLDDPSGRLGAETKRVVLGGLVHREGIAIKATGPVPHFRDGREASVVRSTTLLNASIKYAPTVGMDKMVRQQGQEEGVGVWELDGVEELDRRVTDAFETFRDEQDFVDASMVSFDTAFVAGSYGDGAGVPGKSDLDIVLSVSYRGDPREQAYSQFLRHLAGHLKGNEAAVLECLDGVDELDVLAYPMMEVTQHLQEMGTHEPVETYYALGGARPRRGSASTRRPRCRHAYRARSGPRVRRPSAYVPFVVHREYMFVYRCFSVGFSPESDICFEYCE